MRTLIRSSLTTLTLASMFACGGAPSSPQATGSSEEALIPRCDWYEAPDCSDPSETGRKVICTCDLLDAPYMTQLALGQATVYALDGSGLVYAWGSNEHYALGDGTTASSAIIEPVTLPSTNKRFPPRLIAAHVSAGDTGACAVLKDGTVDCWGAIQTAPTEIDWQQPTPVTGLPPVNRALDHQLAHGANHACVISSYDGTVWCWGDNTHGQLGDGTTTGRTTPAQVPSPSIAQAMQIAAAGDTTCALLSTGQVWCWGDNTHGQIGSDAPGGYDVSPTQTDPYAWGPKTPTWVVGGGAGTFCGGTSSLQDSTFCWGVNGNGQVGNGGNADMAVPYAGPPGDPIFEKGSSVVAFGTKHACVGGYFAGQTSGLTPMRCFGDNTSGQLGTGNNASQLTPATLPVQQQFGVIAANGSFTCGTVDTQHVFFNSMTMNVMCWGANDHGQLGRGTSGGSSNTPAFAYWFDD
jgi:alpha-tubulin suppressor-like RCC1 family protein